MSTAAAFVEPYLDSEYTEHAHVARCEELMRLLISLGANIHGRVCPQSPEVTGTILSLATGRAGLALVEDLLQLEAEADVKINYIGHNAIPNIDASDVTLLHISSRYANFQAVEKLLNCYPELATCCDSKGRLPLHWTVVGFMGSVPSDYVLQKEEIVPYSIRTIEALLKQDITGGLDAQDHSGKTPRNLATHWASTAAVKYHPFRSDATVQLLLESGPDPNIKDKGQQTPLYLLIRSRGSPPPLAVQGCFVQHGARLDDVDADGNTLLHIAASSYLRASTIRFLLDHGTNAAAVHAAGDTPLHKIAQVLYSVSAEPGGVKVQ